jgi:hypothetical protein
MMMQPWRRRRSLITLSLLLLTIILLVIALYESPHLPPVILLELIATGLVLPVGVFGWLTIIGWRHTMRETYYWPRPIIEHCIRLRVDIVGPLLAAVGVAAMVLIALYPTTEPPSTIAQQAPTPPLDETAQIEAGCIEAAGKSLRSHGVDPDRTEPKARIARYCGCMALEIKGHYTRADLMELFANPQKLADDTTYHQIVARCTDAVRSVGR